MFGDMAISSAAPQALAGYGRYGDSIVAHINPEEAELLARVSGGASVNPATGLPEFFPKDENGNPDISGFGSLANEYRADSGWDGYSDLMRRRNDWLSTASQEQRDAVYNQYYGGSRDNMLQGDRQTAGGYGVASSVTDQMNGVAPTPGPGNGSGNNSSPTAPQFDRSAVMPDGWTDGDPLPTDFGSQMPELGNTNNGGGAPVSGAQRSSGSRGMTQAPTTPPTPTLPSAEVGPDRIRFSDIVGRFRRLGQGTTFYNPDGSVGDTYDQVKAARDSWLQHATPEQRAAVMQQYYGGQTPTWFAMDANEMNARRAWDAANIFGNTADFDAIVGRYNTLGQYDLAGYDALVRDRDAWLAAASEPRRNAVLTRHYGSLNPNFAVLDANERTRRTAPTPRSTPAPNLGGLTGRAAWQYLDQMWRQATSRGETPTGAQLAAWNAARDQAISEMDATDIQNLTFTDSDGSTKNWGQHSDAHVKGLIQARLATLQSQVQPTRPTRPMSQMSPGSEEQLNAIRWMNWAQRYDTNGLTWYQQLEAGDANRRSQVAQAGVDSQRQAAEASKRTAAQTGIRELYQNNRNLEDILAYARTQYPNMTLPELVELVPEVRDRMGFGFAIAGPMGRRGDPRRSRRDLEEAAMRTDPRMVRRAGFGNSMVV